MNRIQARKRFKTIRRYAEFLLTQTDFVDCWGRRVGYDYNTVLGKIHHVFPEGRTSIRSLRAYIYTLDPSTRLPVRRRSHKILSREFARALLLQTHPNSAAGLSFETIRTTVKKKFPKAPKMEISQLVAMLPALRREFVRVPSVRR